MDTVSPILSPELLERLNQYAVRHEQTLTEAVSELTEDRLRQDELAHKETLAAIRRGLADVEAGRVSPAHEVYERLRVKHGIPD